MCPASAVTITALAALLALPSGRAVAQNFGDALTRTVQRAVQDETQRKVDEQARRATRCALGDARCAQQAAAAPTDPSGPVTADGADHPLLPPYAGSRLLRREADEFTDYALRTGKSRAIGTRTLEGALTRLTYEGPPARSVLEVFRSYEGMLRQAGFEILYRCERADCGDIRKDIESGPRYMLLWGAGEHRYLAARRTGAQGDAYVALYGTRNGGGGAAKGRAMVQLDVLETRPIQGRIAPGSAAGTSASFHVSPTGVADTGP